MAEKNIRDIVTAGPPALEIEEPPTPLEDTDTEGYRVRVAAIPPDALVDLSLELMASVPPDEIEAILAGYEAAPEEIAEEGLPPAPPIPEGP